MVVMVMMTIAVMMVVMVVPPAMMVMMVVVAIPVMMMVMLRHLHIRVGSGCLPGQRVVSRFDLPEVRVPAVNVDLGEMLLVSTRGNGRTELSETLQLIDPQADLSRMFTCQLLSQPPASADVTSVQSSTATSENAMKRCRFIEKFSG